eukprot:CAMPEP_0183356694 /NCGR_PEP_ID=MMETSP0164_2-20130417/45134_1 /TAXON_ID=221442 /ORGANISM="Coccolithus pelagicus ssp braarudi, Strain PLY182g" /LENGTH=124 /DNA_ID=CAMNT_0025530167 /DNA_START=16 /DNA_END=390 /DNA_ORIENTATION=-
MLVIVAAILCVASTSALHAPIAPRAALNGVTRPLSMVDDGSDLTPKVPAGPVAEPLGLNPDPAPLPGNYLERSFASATRRKDQEGYVPSSDIRGDKILGFVTKEQLLGLGACALIGALAKVGII